MLTVSPPGQRPRVQGNGVGKLDRLNPRFKVCREQREPGRAGPHPRDESGEAGVGAVDPAVDLKLAGEPRQEVEPVSGRREHQRAANQVGGPQLVAVSETVQRRGSRPVARDARSGAPDQPRPACRFRARGRGRRRSRRGPARPRRRADRAQVRARLPGQLPGPAPVQQPCAEFSFQRGDPLGQRLLADRQRRSGPPEMAFVSNRHEGPHPGQIEVHKSLPPMTTPSC